MRIAIEGTKAYWLIFCDVNSRLRLNGFKLFAINDQAVDASHTKSFARLMKKCHEVERTQNKKDA
ncbi:hypothetical protein PCAR4_150096 [Paraburkholderia caribensis]|nr:hypothetical protein PCAR4_150096 [Paraburkholderia caribensis]